MPAASILPSALERQLLIQLGGRLKAVRKAKGITAVSLAESVGISRMTLSAVEAGEPAPTMGTYLRVMSALGVASDLALVASGELRAQVTGEPSPTFVVATSGAPHEAQDLQSLLLHEAAIDLVRRQPELVARALEILEQWRSSGSGHSRVLLDEWSVILRRRDWRKALARSRRSQELRQASPLPVLLPDDVRRSVLADVRRVKQGVPVGQLAPPAVAKSRRAKA